MFRDLTVTIQRFTKHSRIKLRKRHSAQRSQETEESNDQIRHLNDQYLRDNLEIIKRNLEILYNNKMNKILSRVKCQWVGEGEKIQNTLRI